MPHVGMRLLLLSPFSFARAHTHNNDNENTVSIVFAILLIELLPAPYPSLKSYLKPCVVVLTSLLTPSTPCDPRYS